MEQNPTPSQPSQPVPTPPSPPPTTNPPESYPPHKPTSKIIMWGFIVAIILVGGYLGYLYLTQPPAPVKVQAVTSPTPQPFYLTLTNPTEEVTVANGELLVAGKTLPKTIVIVYTDTDETSLESDDKGNFETTVVVGEEGGLVRVTAFSESGEEMSKTFNTSESGAVDVLGKADKAVEKGPPTKDEKPNEQKMMVEKQNTPEKAEKLANQELSKENKQEKIQDFLKNEVEQKKSEKVGAKELKRLLTQVSTESAMLDSNVKLKKMVVLEASTGAVLKRHAVSGVITSVAEGVLVIAHQTQRERTNAVYYNASTVIASKNMESTGSAAFAVGMRIAAVGEPLDDGVLAKRIHVIPGKATGVFNKQPVATDEGENVVTPTITPQVTETISPTPTDIPVTVTPTPSI